MRLTLSPSLSPSHSPSSFFSPSRLPSFITPSPLQLTPLPFPIPPPPLLVLLSLLAAFNFFSRTSSFPTPLHPPSHCHHSRNAAHTTAYFGEPRRNLTVLD